MELSEVQHPSKKLLTMDQATILGVLESHKHPFMLVGVIAHRWMGCASGVDEGFDIVLRNDQLKTIVIDIINTGLWSPFDAAAEREIFEAYPSNKKERKEETYARQMLLNHCCDADAVLQRTNPQDARFEYLRIWSEDTYHIKVDQCPVIEVPDIYPWNCCLVEEELHPAARRDDGWWYGPYTLDGAKAAGRSIFGPVIPVEGPKNSSPIFIPRIPAYLDTLVSQAMRCQKSKPQLHSFAQWQIRNLTRYLYLEVPHQRDVILFQVEEETESYLQDYFKRYKRKPHTLFLGEKESARTVVVNVWDPKTFPEEYRKRWIKSS
jgi:hypothetical protein